MPRPCGHTREVPGTGCTLCAVAAKDARYAMKWDGVAPSQPASRYKGQFQGVPCRYLGDATGETRNCESCGGGKNIPLHFCEKHGVCTPDRRLLDVSWCRTCRDYSAASAASEIKHAVRLPIAALARRIVQVDPPGQQPGRVAFNCTMLEVRGKLLLGYRLGWSGSRLAICELDGDYRPVGQPSLLEHRRLPEDASGQEDPRLFILHGVPHLSYIGVQTDPKGEVTTHQCFARLSPSGRSIAHTWCPHYKDRQGWEKNWAGFEHDGELHAVYSIRPHRVLKIQDSHAELVASSPGPPAVQAGLSRGGSPPVQIDGEYYHWFHGKKQQGSESEYWVGLYTFEAKPPFRPKRVCRTSLIQPNRSDRPKGNPIPPHCVFPCGAILRNGVWAVSFGYYDRWCMVAEFDAGTIESALDAVS